jgi:BMFP domain-containing protein YqiC
MQHSPAAACFADAAISYSDLRQTRTSVFRRATYTVDSPQEWSPAMLDLRPLDDLAQRLTALLPPGAEAASEDLRKTFRTTLEAGIARLDLVTREEFDVQRAVLLKTREKLEALERQLAELEAQLAARPSN